MLKALILIGGKSTRMGRDKFLLEPNGKPQYIHLHEMLMALELETFISCNDGQNALIPSSYKKVLDLKDSIGPIGGLYSAIKEDPESSWLVIACDLIKINKVSLKQLIDSYSGDCDIVTFQKEDSSYFETTATIYKPSCFKLINEHVDTGNYSLQRILKKSKVKTLAGSDEVLKNANSSEDLL
ncbi:MAG: molybdenum cofactor guanylyltransferase [Cyclobacteriaceae bacterium]